MSVCETEKPQGRVIKHSVCLWKAHVTQLGNAFQMTEKLPVYSYAHTEVLNQGVSVSS